MSKKWYVVHAYSGFEKNVARALGERVGAPTIPQIFIGGTHLGGCTDVIALHAEGRLADLLRGADVDFDASAEIDGWAFLPKWVHPRKTA